MKKKPQYKKQKGQILYRTFEITEETIRAIGDDNREIEVIFSTEDAQVQRYFGNESLGHSKGEVRLERLKQGGAVLVGHNQSEQVGVVEVAKIDSGSRQGLATLRFGNSAKAEEIFQDVKDRIRRFVSVGYRVYKTVLERIENDVEFHRVVDWEPVEISIVPVPADPNAEILRHEESADFETLIETRGLTMETDNEKRIRLLKEAETRTLKTEETAFLREHGEEIPAPKTPAVDKTAIVRNEQTRIREITAIGEQFDMAEEAVRMIDNNRTIDEMNQHVVDEMKKRGWKSKTTPTSADADIGLTKTEARKFSIANVVRALAHPKNKAFQKVAGFEMECSRAVSGVLGTEPQGFYLPNDALRETFAVDGKRDLTVGVAADGGDLVATDLLSGSFIEALTNALALGNAGTTVLSGLVGNIAIPKKTGTGTAYWVAENIAPTESQLSVGQVLMSPNTVGAFTDFSRKLLLQSSLSIENLVRNDLIEALVLAIDLAGVNGSGTGAEPEGILNTTGIGSVVGGVNGLAPTWSHIVQLESAVANANAQLGSLSYLTNTKVRGKLKETEKFSGGGKEIWGDGDMPLNGSKAIISNQVPSDLTKGTSVGVASAIIYGNFADLVLGLWGSLDIAVDPYTASTTGGTRIVALQDVDYGVRNAASFAAMLDALTA